jgi:hypothetical protein
MTINQTYWKQAQKTASILGWDSLLIYSQWQLETGHFSSNNFKNNNNIAGQTWNSKLHPLSMRGTARPTGEGGYYIKYPSPVEGYIDFIKKNHRYDDVKTGKTAEEQAEILAGDGWAVDPKYADKLKSLIKANRLLLGSEVKVVKKQVKPSVSETPPKPLSLVEYMKSKGMKTDFASRRILADKLGIKHYSGTADENVKLLGLLQKRK